MTAWNPFDTAPTDGTKIIGWDEDVGAKETRFVDFDPDSQAGRQYIQGHGKRGCFEWYDPYGNAVYHWNFKMWIPFPD